MQHRVSLGVQVGGQAPLILRRHGQVRHEDTAPRLTHEQPLRLELAVGALHRRGGHVQLGSEPAGPMAARAPASTPRS